MIRKDISEFIVEKDITIKEAMERITENKKGIVFVTEGGKLIGTLSDGDIRRAIVRGTSLYAPIDKFLNVSYIFTTAVTEEELLALSQKTKTTVIPIVDRENKVKRIYFRDL